MARFLYKSNIGIKRSRSVKSWSSSRGDAALRNGQLGYFSIWPFPVYKRPFLIALEIGGQYYTVVSCAQEHLINNLTFC